MRQTRSTAGGDELFGQPVWRPRRLAVRARTENERASVDLCALLPSLSLHTGAISDQDVERGPIELHPVRAVRLRPAELGAIRALDQGPRERDRGALLVEVPPPEREQLAATGTSGHREPEEAVERGVGATHRVEEHRHLMRARRADLGRYHPRRRRVRRGVEPNPLPAHRLAERPVQDAVDAGDRSRRERTVPSPTGPHEMTVEVVDVGRSQLGDIEVAEVRLEIALDDGVSVAGRGYRPAG